MKRPKDIRSMLYLAAAAVLAPAVFVAQFLRDPIPSLFSIAWVAGIVVFLVSMLIAVGRGNDLHGRRPRFAVAPEGFHARPAVRPAAYFLPISICLAYMLASAVRRWSDSDGVLGPILFAATIIGGLGCCLLFVFVMGRTFVTLTPEGVGWGLWLFRQRVAWNELLPGGPIRPLSGDSHLRLDLRDGKRSFSTHTDTHPWFVADAIRWYAEHPEHRAGIGTQAEHDRLVRDLGVKV